MEALVAWDKFCGEAVHARASRSGWQHLATAASLCLDEVVWFPSTLLLALAHVAAAALAPGIHARLLGGAPARLSVDAYHDVVMITGLTCLLKLLTMRPRPAYAKQEAFYIVNGDRFSFPSSHAMFATALARVATGQRGTSVVCKVAGLVGIAVIGWSRVAKGRHYPSDVAAGTVLGALLAEVALRGLHSVLAACRFAFALVFLCEVVLVLVVPRLRTPGFKLGAAFLAFYCALLPLGTSPCLGPSTAWVACPLAAASAAFGWLPAPKPK